MRIAKAIAHAGLCSRRDAEAWIAAGRVAVNGTVLTTPAHVVNPSDTITVDGKPLPQAQEARLWRYHKRRGLVTSHKDPQGRKTVFEALPPGLPRVVSVGRLDINTEGLLLLTTDGELARHLELPSTGWIRRYRVRAHGRVSQEALDRLRQGITIDGVHYGPVEARIDREQGANLWLTTGFARRQEPRGEAPRRASRLDRQSADPRVVRALRARRSRRRRGRGSEAACACRSTRIRSLPKSSACSRRPRNAGGGADERMRIVAGKFRGAQIEAPKGLGTRPTSDRVRQALFNVLEHGAPRFDFDGARVLDLFAGSGALGLEALSRGARYCLFIEEDAAARAAIRRNVEALGLTGVTKIWRRDATKLGEAGALQPFQLVFCDPPYGKGLGERALAEAVNRGWAEQGAVAVLEERADADVAWPGGCEEIDRRRYGDTQIVIARVGH